MKNIFLVLFVIGFLTVNAQDKLDKIANEMCESLSKKDLSGISDMNSFTSELAPLMADALSKLSKKELKKLDVDLFDEQSVSKFGEKIGEIMGVKCDPFITLITKLMTKEDSELLEIVKEQEGIKSDKKFGDADGKLVSVNKTDFLSITVKHEDDNENKYYFLKEFDGAKAFIDSLESYQNKDVEISFVKYKVYNSASNSFKNIKEIKSISLQ